MHHRPLRSLRGTFSHLQRLSCTKCPSWSSRWVWALLVVLRQNQHQDLRNGCVWNQGYFLSYSPGYFNGEDYDYAWLTTSCIQMLVNVCQRIVVDLDYKGLCCSQELLTPPSLVSPSGNGPTNGIGWRIDLARLDERPCFSWFFDVQSPIFLVVKSFHVWLPYPFFCDTQSLYRSRSRGQSCEALSSSETRLQKQVPFVDPLMSCCHWLMKS